MTARARIIRHSSPFDPGEIAAQRSNYPSRPSPHVMPPSFVVGACAFPRFHWPRRGQRPGFAKVTENESLLGDARKQCAIAFHPRFIRVRAKGGFAPVMRYHRHVRTSQSSTKLYPETRAAHARLTEIPRPGFGRLESISRIRFLAKLSRAIKGA